jgi:UDP-N-acetylmuramate-alanine ligase
MDPLAIFLSGAGFSVSGEDDGMTDAMASQLTRAGVRIGPMGEACELVVHSSAIRAGHPARCAASARHLPMVRRGELLAELAKSYNLVAVCGSHGKTTTTAMLVTALRAAGFPCGYVLGGLFGDAGIPPARVGANGWLVAEIDESDGTIGNFAPAVTLAVNLDWDHPDFYREQADLERAFGGLFARTTQAVIVNRHCALSAKVSPSTAVTFGGAGADFAGEVVAACGENMRLRLGGRFSITEAVVRARGDFNAVNATAALAAAQIVGAKLSHEALANYPGVRRRQCLVPAESG